ncbi:MAG: hypothetical protein ABI415_11810, partial [Flavitalea sp.]
INADNIDLPNQKINLKEISLANTSANIRMGKSNAPANPAIKVVDTAGNNASGWRLLVKNIALDNNNIILNDDSKPMVAKGIDYSHIDAKGITLHADNMVYGPDTISASITKGMVTEKSGLVLKTFETDFLYAGHEAYLKKLLIETPGTTLKRSIALKYPSLDVLKKDIGKLQLNVDLNDSKVLVKDILTFVPSLASQPALSNPNATIYMSGVISGSVADMNIGKLQIRAFSNTNVDIKGTVSGLPDAKKLSGNLMINNFQTSRKDIELLAPKGSLPKTITIPENINLRGTIAGSMKDGRGKLNLVTSLGNASVDGHIANPTDKKRVKYNATLSANKLNLGIILQNDSLFGPLTATIVASGSGFDPKTANANIKATVVSAVLNRYEYKDAKITAALGGQKATADFVINDPNIAINLKGMGDVSGKYPVISFTADINELKTFPLHFTTDTLEYKGNISAAFSNTDPANLQGQLLVTKSILSTPEQKYPLDTIALTAGKTDSGQFVRLKSDAISFALTGKYNLTQLASVFKNALQPYYAISKAPAKPDTLQDYDFRFSAQVINGPLLKIFVPSLTQIEPVNINGHFATGNGFSANVDAPLLVMGDNRIQKFKLNAATGRGILNLNTNIELFSSGATMKIYSSSIDTKIANNKINFLINLKDIDNKNKYRIGGLINQSDTGVYALNLNPASLMLNYDKWVIAENNMVKFNNGDVNISNFTISKSGQELSINSTSLQSNSPLEIKFGNFRIGTITAFAKQDSALADGIINGGILVKNIKKQPVFTSDLTITDLMFRTDTVGNLVLKVNNNVADTYSADINLTGNGNDVAIKGDYVVKPADQSVINLNMDIRALQMKSMQAFSMGAISRSKGFINGKFDFAGTFDKPKVDGNLNFNDVGFSSTMLGSYFAIDKQV